MSTITNARFLEKTMNPLTPEEARMAGTAVGIIIGALVVVLLILAVV